MFLSGSEKLCSKDQYSFITIFEEFKQSCWGAEINMVHPMGEPSAGPCGRSTSSLTHERELWACSSECPVCIGKACRNTQESRAWSFSAPLGRTVRHAFVFGVWGQEGQSARWPDHCAFLPGHSVKMRGLFE